MDKKSIIGIAVVAVLFLGFAYFNSQQQKEYLEQKAAYEAYVDSVAAAARAAAPVADSLASGNGVQAEVAAAEAAAAVRERQVETLGESLTAAREAEAEEFIVENDVMAVLFSTRGGQIKGVTLKDYTQYGPRGKRDRKIEMMDPATARFGLSFYLKNGLKNVPVNTLDYVFTAQPVVGEADGAKSVVMRLPVAEGAYLEYRYLIYDTAAPERDYLVDFDVRLVNMAPEMANQTQIQIDWANTTFQNEKGFQNENMYTTLSYRFPDETSIEELGMSEGAKSKNISTQVNWVAFKQQFFSSVFIAPDNVSYANLAFDTAAPESSLLKTFTAQMGVPYTPQTEGYDFAFYFGPNKYSILKKIGEPGGADIYLERLVPLGWGIFGWVNRWCVIPVFDFLRNYIGSFGIIIFILVLLVKLVISPLTYKSYVSMAKMRLVKPQIDELAKKYPKPEDAMKKQQATMELYKKAGINPMGGCIPMLIQMPILIAMFRFFPASIELREQPFLWADDLSSYDSIVNLPFSIPFYGDHVSLFALLMAVSLFGYSWFNYQQTASSQPQMAGMKFMMVYMMPIMMLFWFNSYSSGLCYYYLLSNIFTIGQTLVIRRMVDDNKIHAIMQANAAKKSKGKKSKFQQRYEELMRQQEAQQRAKRK
ncbi:MULTISPECIES: membrane protein insertase YidC [Alistipes]|uniref:Membrane protein insertase YidC n=1 Tax=Alistipes shahii WAL 8301 TaxID=717959 RepID=D4ILQ7_9BACT|nr:MULTISPECIES: membrane protein insertase YidC [Alistipes]MBS5476802.1 membrane protein insertase YidC [Alistipes sp.]UWN67624.1 membrane protein insertase YidC [Alistipes shahii WAL 8301]CBK63869.1 membrane protein insertase, YidC/Oxa1 family, C-terminal domain [Alistipes shahii WAL 8301]